MRKNPLRLLWALTLCAAALAVNPWSSSLLSQQQGDAQGLGAGPSARKTLRELARERNVERVSHSEAENEYADVRSLTKAANAIVLGRLTGGEASFDGDDSIITTYQVEVRRVLKDIEEGPPEVRSLSGYKPPAPLQPTIKLVRGGGTVRVNGHTASVKPDGAKPLSVNADYILFLWWSPSFNAYYLAGGNSGVVLVDDARRIKPLGAALNAKHRGQDVENFVLELLN
jgi:hypothetical protein